MTAEWLQRTLMVRLQSKDSCNVAYPCKMSANCLKEIGCKRATLSQTAALLLSAVISVWNVAYLHHILWDVSCLKLFLVTHWQNGRTSTLVRKHMSSMEIQYRNGDLKAI